MKPSLTVVLLLCLAVEAMAQSDTAPRFQVKPYSPPAYEQAPGLSKRVAKPEYDAALGDDRFTLEKLQYNSDGLAVTAYLYRPRKAGGKLPLIIYNRGGYLEPTLPPELLPQFHRLVLAGFVVLAPMYRQSDGAAGIDQVGGDDLDDVLNLRPLLPGLPGVDDTQVFLLGESRGGMMVYQALREGFPAQAAAVYGAFTDFKQLTDAQPQLYGPLLTKLFPDYAQQQSEIIRRRSATAWADKINVPILIMQGTNDKSVSPMQSLKLAEKLQELGKPYELVMVDGENHTLSHDAVQRDALVTAWFRQHIQQSKP
jgi:dipeptidyl aminopeptidase/acylaminoacyl peptidase